MSLSAAASVGTPSPNANFGLVLDPNGEYSAASVAAHPILAAALGLVKEIDGGYGFPTSPASRTAPTAQTALFSLKKGG
jgi:hypothetical protein